MGKLLDVARRWLVPTASKVATEARVIVVNEIWGAVYEVTQGRRLPERADTRMSEPSIGEPIVSLHR